MVRELSFVLVPICLCVIVFGHYSWGEKNGKMVESAVVNFKHEEEEKIRIASETWLGVVEPTVVTLGSSVTRGNGATTPENSWVGLLKEEFLKTNKDLQLYNFGTDGFTTRDIFENSLNKTIRAKPDVILFEVCTINDINKLSLSESKKNISKIVTELNSSFPDSRVILMLPNIPISTQENKEGYTFREYASEIEAHIKSSEWEYIEYWDMLERQYSIQNLTLNDVLADGVHPNDKGYNIWFNAIKDNFIK